MAIVLMIKCCLIALLFDWNSPLYSHGMEPEQKGTKKLLNGPSVLDRRNTPPIDSQIGRVAPHEHGSRRIPSAEQSQRLLQEKEDVEEKIRKLPYDPFGMDHPWAVAEQSAQMELFKKQQQQQYRNDFVETPYSNYNQFISEGSSSSRYRNSGLKVRAIQKNSGGKEKKNKWWDREELMLQQIRKEQRKVEEKERRKKWTLSEDQQVKKESAITLMRENESKDTKYPNENSHKKNETKNAMSSSERPRSEIDHSNNSSEMSGNLEDLEEKSDYKSSESPNIMENEEHKQIHATSSSLHNINEEGSKKTEKEPHNQQEIFHSRVDSIVRSVHQLEKDKAACMKIKNKQKRKNKILNLKDAYLKIMSALEEYSALYSEEKKNIVYFGDLFAAMNNANKEGSTIDQEYLKWTMEESLNYLAENDLLFLDNMLKSIGRLKEFIASYDGTEEAKAEMVEWYKSNVESEICNVFRYIFVGLSPNVNLTRHAVFGGLFLFYKILPSLHKEFLEARQTVDKYMDILYGSEEENRQQKSKTEREDYHQIRDDEKNQLLPVISAPSASRAPDSKDKEVVAKFDSFERIPGLYSRIDSIIEMVEKLERDKGECMNIADDDEQKKRLKMSEIMHDYKAIMENLEDFSVSYYRNANMVVYIADLFTRMKRDHYKATLIDMMQIMQETLAFLDGNFKNPEEDIMHFDKLFENVSNMKEHLLAYENAAKSNGPKDPRTEQAKATMIQWFTKVAEEGFRHVFRFLFVGLHNAKSPWDMVNLGLKKLTMILPNRKHGIKIAGRRMFNYYMKVGQFGEFDKNLSERAENLNKNIEFVVKKIMALEKAKELSSDKCVDQKQKERLKICYQLAMDSLTSFASDYGQERRSSSNFFVDIIDWMMDDLYMGMEDVQADELNTTMRSSLSLLQGNTCAEDLTTFAVLLQDIDLLKSKEASCDKLAKSPDGYKIRDAREALHNLRAFYLREVEPKLQKAIGYVFIGVKNGSDERMSKDKILAGLAKLSETALPRYKQGFHESVNKMAVFNEFLRKSSVQEIGENLAEYIARILQIDFDPEDRGTNELDKLADKLEYPQIYEDGLKAIDELINQLKNEVKETSNESPSGSSKGAGKGGNEKVVVVETDQIIKFGPVDNFNWEEVLNDARNMIRYMNISEKMLVAEKNQGKKVYEEAVYLRAWAIMLHQKFASILNKWKEEFGKLQKDKNSDQTDVTTPCPYTILKFYSEGISNLAVHHRKLNKVKRRMIRIALEEMCNQLQKMQHLPSDPDEVDEPW